MINVEQILNDYGKELVARLQNDIRTKRVTKYGAVNASGDLASSIRYEVNGSVMTIYGNDYIYYLQYGRGKNRNQSPEALKKWAGWAGSTFIKDWVEAKGLDLNPFAVAMNIAKKGTEIWRQGGSTLVSGIFNEELQKEIENSFANLLVTEIQSDILKLAA